MRIISLHQFWASAMAYGFKRNETRSWSTPYRGWLAIHASKTKEWRTDYEGGFAEECLRPCGYKTFDALPFGAIVCVVYLYDCVRTESIVRNISDMEFDFGDYTFGRYAWLTKSCFRFNEPLPYRGQQGMWTLPTDVVAELRKRATLKNTVSVDGHALESGRAVDTLPLRSKETQSPRELG